MTDAVLAINAHLRQTSRTRSLARRAAFSQVLVIGPQQGRRLRQPGLRPRRRVSLSICDASITEAAPAHLAPISPPDAPITRVACDARLPKIIVVAIAAAAAVVVVVAPADVALVALAPILPHPHRPRAADAWGMNTSVSAYTNLESLLLFQCLHAYGVAPSVFGRISDLLKQNPDITTHKYFQPGRLSPDALRNFYLERLKRELEHEQGSDADAQHGQVANSAKRKRHSPSLPTVQESLQHQHLIPKLVTKLYASYRRELTEQIRADEERYERLQLQLKSIEHGEWDHQLREKANGRTPEVASSRPEAFAASPTAPDPEWTVFTSPAQEADGYAATTTAASAITTTPGLLQLQWHTLSKHLALSSSWTGSSEYTVSAKPPPIAVAYPQASTPTGTRQPSRPILQTPGAARPGVPPVHPLVTQARNPLSTPTNLRSPVSALGTPVSARSFWKRSSLGEAPAMHASPRPEVEPLDDVPPLIRPKQTPPKAKAQRKSRAKGKGKEAEQHHPTADTETPQSVKQPNDAEEDSMLEPETRSGRSRRKAPAKRARPGSITSSRAGGSVRDRSRSQSILSHTDTIAADNESQAGNRIKSERGTSVEAIEEEGSAETPSHMSTRRRGPAATSAPLSTRRKRNAREASLDEQEDHMFSTPGPPKTLVAPRNFARMTAPMMYDINSHKHASTFNTAVRAKDAEGYYDIIKRPTDLTSIKKAVATGAKQVSAAAAASDNPTGSPGGATGGVVELPVTVDNVPPKSIVNATQLEKELMRMFVNAVMFNPGEEGVVNDARDMFQTVQGLVSTWRDVERHSGRVGNEDTPTVEDDDAPTATTISSIVRPNKFFATPKL
ncbi:conserved hypothetical protein [Pyrenophora tritici-repentis Pt-1C-BFP]|uniref:Bromo domain-containing protein n=1 Tax=Pyrenophora tritici-repentis (strain Pt-1C-BFP) TaxID=426418 RepID=B2W6I4_PYRTR|nr:uncharacterized protein PTRG_05422 [Pyrenophora tritici-repentis Pt-1C-BFP]EDU48342.1 conserved hypothetical protein [Pyrenophora tritici-repentis Pt-1C-BFP]